MIEKPMAAESVAEDEPNEGSTFALTPEGWQPVDYVEPERDWDVLPDGSFGSPDGSLRTWPPEDLAGDAPAG